VHLRVDTDVMDVLLRLLSIDSRAFDIILAPAFLGVTIVRVRLIHAKVRQRLIHDVVLDELGDTTDLARAADVGILILTVVIRLLGIEGRVATVDDRLQGLDSFFLKFAVALGPLSTDRLPLGLIEFCGRSAAAKDATFGLVIDVSLLSVEGGAAGTERLGSGEGIGRVGVSLIHVRLKKVHLLGSGNFFLFLVLGDLEQRTDGLAYKLVVSGELDCLDR
jgi:hypothetical protein